MEAAVRAAAVVPRLVLPQVALRPALQRVDKVVRAAEAVIE